MNTYLVPIAEPYSYNYDHLYMICAKSQQEAYENVQRLYNDFIVLNPKLQIMADIKYDTFPNIELHTEHNYFRIEEKDVILKEALDRYYNTESESDCMDIYNYMYWKDYNAQIQELAEKALPEKWNLEGRNDNNILKNYLRYTFNKLQEEGKIIETDTYCVFNTGLFSHYYEPIYVYGEPNLRENENASKWYFKGFKDTYELGSMDIESDFPERADYFSDPKRLVFNWHYKININYKHILDNLNTSQRLPDCVKNSENPLDTLKGVIDTAIQKVTANYKLAVPTYYQNKIQLLVPLYFGKSTTPSVALTLDLKKNGYYQASTCLTMEMAYMDARLIAKPESNWLVAENIISDETDLK